MQKDLYALGIGHNSPVFIDLALACGYSIAGLYHYNNTRTGEIDHGYEILGSFDDLFAKGSLEGMSFLLTMGDNKIRTELSDKFESNFRFARARDFRADFFPRANSETRRCRRSPITGTTPSLRTSRTTCSIIAWRKERRNFTTRFDICLFVFLFVSSCL